LVMVYCDKQLLTKTLIVLGKSLMHKCINLLKTQLLENLI